MLTAAFLGGYLIQISYPWTKDVPEGKVSPQASDPAIKRYAEALRYIEERAMFSDSVGNVQDMATESLKAFLAQKDPNSGKICKLHHDAGSGLARRHCGMAHHQRRPDP